MGVFSAAGKREEGTEQHYLQCTHALDTVPQQT